MTRASLPFADDTSTSWETAFAKIEDRLQGTELAAQAIGLVTTPGAGRFAPPCPIDCWSPAVGNRRLFEPADYPEPSQGAFWSYSLLITTEAGQ
ncbi:hypothetical protein OG978_40665 [Streptomyces sp. NBC_01591]|uniref:hypothetical protein n=1 Tax=Streptomyces sp. NBC_01591 TaxID=2975888 RepID=UPI0030849E1E|nr:hypothetical protein OG978_00160 [Streptomyces sp. NBC_01591]WSD73091.1 hypothetical protein OG978_40665 [Streptomyces sp. NBC_01591]